MYFYNFITCSQYAFCSGPESKNNILDFFNAQLVWHHLAWFKRNGRWCNRLPAIFAFGNLLATIPG
ncbi:hypothetical protein D3C73_1195380 [compost metagenome]